MTGQAREAHALRLLTHATRSLSALTNDLDVARTEGQYEHMLQLAEKIAKDAGYIGWLTRKLTGGDGHRQQTEGTRFVALNCNEATHTEEAPEVPARASSPVA